MGIKKNPNQNKELRIHGKRRKGERWGNTGICGKIRVLLMLLKDLRESLENQLKSLVLDFILKLLGCLASEVSPVSACWVLAVPFRTCGVYWWVFYVTLRSVC